MYNMNPYLFKVNNLIQKNINPYKINKKIDEEMDLIEMQEFNMPTEEQKTTVEFNEIMEDIIQEQKEKENLEAYYRAYPETTGYKFSRGGCPR